MTPNALRRESLVGGLEQESFGSNGIDDAGNITFAATIKNPNAPPTRFASLWENDTLVFLEGDVIPAGPLAGNSSTRPVAWRRSPSGVSSWVSRYASTSLGDSAGSALFRNTTTFEVLLQSGDNDWNGGDHRGRGGGH